MPAEPGQDDASVANQLTGLLAKDSPYLTLARQSGLRTASRRGLLNSSIAAGASEAAAIAAAAPIASQDAAQIHQRNQVRLEAWNQLRNATTVQGMQEAGANYRQLSGERNAIILNNSTNQAAFDRLMAQGEIEKAMEILRSQNNMKQTQVNAQVSLIGNYMTAFGQLASNPELPSSARSTYQREFLRVTNQTQALINALAGVQVTFPAAPAPGG